MNLNRKCYVYRFIDTHGKTVYVGESWNLQRRINQHISLKSGKFTKDSLKQIHRIEYFIVNDKISARQHELYFINKYKSKYNISDKYNNVIFTENKLYEKRWKLYKEFNKSHIKLSKTKNRIIIIAIYIVFIYTCLILFINMI